jgi:hypothetical protein
MDGYILQKGEKETDLKRESSKKSKSAKASKTDIKRNREIK